MDVTCERCGTEYEFDETLVSDRGTTVKCTNCGHLFKVFRGDGASSGEKAWHVEAADGTQLTLGSLKELQRMIAEGRLTQNDQISRGGEGWKRLGDIAELSTFFATATTQVDDDGTRRARTNTKPGAGGKEGGRASAKTVESTPASRSAAAKPAQRQQKATMLGMGVNATDPAMPAPVRADSTERRAAPPPSPSRPPPPAPPRPLPPPSRPLPDPESTAQAKPGMRVPAPPASEPPPPPPPPSQFVSEAPPDAPPQRRLYLEDEEPAAPPRPAKSRAGLWVALVVLLAAGVGVALGWPQIAPLLGLARTEDPAAPFLTAGDAALAADDIESYERARDQYTQALAHGANDPRVLSRLSRAHALWAQALAFDASDLEATAAQDPAARGRAEAIRAEVARHARTARERAEDAVRHGSNDADARAALADALRLSGDLPLARSSLERALTLRPEANAETLRVAALLAAAEANGDLSAASTKAEEAVAEDPALIRARLLYARALLAARDVGAARQQVARVLQRSPQHGRAIALRDAIEEGRPPAPPTVVVPDGGVADAGPAQAVAPTAPVVAPPVEGTEPRPGQPAVAPTGGAPPGGRDYSFYIREADARLDRHDLNGARQYYESALSARPNGSEALTGLGYVALEQGNANGAAERFVAAARQGYGDAYIGLGAAYRRLNRNDDALRAYERYLERLPNGPRAAEAQRNVDQLRGAGGGAPPPPRPDPPPGGEPAPPTTPGTLPPPRGVTEPPANDTPAVGTEN